MRRIVTIALLMILSLPLLSPLFAAGGWNSALPACCRRDGKHHCAMSSMQTSTGTDAGHQFSSIQERCPYCPSSIQWFGSHADAPWLSASTTIPFPPSFALSIAQTEAHYRISSERARQKRGPPPSLLHSLVQTTNDPRREQRLSSSRDL